MEVDRWCARKMALGINSALSPSALAVAAAIHQVLARALWKKRGIPCDTLQVVFFHSLVSPLFSPSLTLFLLFQVCIPK